MHTQRTMIAAALVAAFGSVVNGSVPAVSVIDAGRLMDRDRVVGYELQVNQPVTITELGKFDANQNGRLDDLTSPLVGIWQMDSRELIVSSTIDLNSTAEFGAFYSAIEPITLQPGSYVIGTQMFNEQEPYSYCLKESWTCRRAVGIAWKPARFKKGSGGMETPSRAWA